MTDIPAGLLPDPSQVPPSVKTPEDLKRFQLCFAIGRMIAGRDDPLFVRELYASDIATGDLGAIDEHPEPTSGGQLELR